MHRRCVVVTGAGVVSPCGFGGDLLWTAACSGRTGVGPVILTREVNHRVMIAAQVKDADLALCKKVAGTSAIDRHALFAMAAADEAVSQSGLKDEGRLGERTAVIIGTGIGGGMTIEDTLFDFYFAKNRIDPMTVPRAMTSAAVSLVSIRFGCMGPCFAVSSACSSAAQAIGLGMHLIESGLVDRAIVGGSESPITPVGLRCWEALRVLTPDACRPFSTGRNGMVLGEGAAIFVIEEADLARARGALPMAELAGYGTSSDAGDMLRPDPASAARAMSAALKHAATAPQEVDYVNAHGTGTMANDISETQALKTVFGPHIGAVAVSSTKPIHGHALGAAGALELYVTIRAMNEGILPPTINWLGPDPSCDIDVVPNEARPKPIRVAISNSFAFGGINAVLAIRRTS